MARRGPCTPEGKTVAAANAVRHGALSPLPVLAGVEDPALWEAHRMGVQESLAPVGHLEMVLAERVALLLWRLGRVARYEGEVIAQRQEDALKDTVETVTLSEEGSRGFTLPQVRDREAVFRGTVRLLRAFASWPDDRAVKPDQAAEVVYAVEERADLTGRQRAALSYPGVPDGRDIEDASGWTAGQVRACLEAIGRCSGRDPEELLAAAVEHVEAIAAYLHAIAERLQLRVDAERRQRILPEGAILEKVGRYEANLHRQLTSTLHELEALQARRAGRPAPLARGDVSGLSDE